MYRAAAAIVTALSIIVAAPCHAGTFVQAAKLGGFAREWLVHTPPQYKRGHPLPLVILYHGQNGSPQGIESNSHLDNLADRMGFIVVYPAGVEGTWASHSFTKADAANVDDVAFTEVLLDNVELKYSIDPQHVVLAGFSMGARMVNLLGCRLADRIVGIVAVSGTLMADLAAGCQPSRPLTVIEFHGSADPFIPMQGGYTGPNKTGFSTPVEANIAAWASRDKCGETPATSLLPGTHEFPSTQVENFSGCPAGTQVRLYEVMGAGHVWPAGQPVDASVLIGELAVKRTVY